MISAVSPMRTLGRSFSYTSQTTQTDERSEIVNGARHVECLHARCIRHLLIGDHARDGRYDVHDAAGLSGSLPRSFRCSAVVSTSTLGFVFGVLRDL